MAFGGDLRPPYSAVIGLYAWLTAGWNRLDGHLLSTTGRSLEELNARQVLNVTYTYLVARVEGLDRMLGMDSELTEEEKEAARDRENARQMSQLHTATSLGPDYRRARQLVRSRRRDEE